MKWYQIRWAQKYWGKESSDLIICQLGMDTNKVAPLVGKTHGAASHSWGGGSPKKSNPLATTKVIAGSEILTSNHIKGSSPNQCIGILKR